MPLAPLGVPDLLAHSAPWDLQLREAAIANHVALVRPHKTVYANHARLEPIHRRP